MSQPHTFLASYPTKEEEILIMPLECKGQWGMFPSCLVQFYSLYAQTYFSNDKSFPLVSQSLFQVYSCANNWLIRSGSLEMSGCEVAFVVQHFGKTFLHFYRLGHEVRQVLAQLLRRAFWVNTSPAYEPCSNSTPSCFMCKTPPRHTASTGAGLEITHHLLPSSCL